MSGGQNSTLPEMTRATRENLQKKKVAEGVLDHLSRCLLESSPGTPSKAQEEKATPEEIITALSKLANDLKRENEQALHSLGHVLQGLSNSDGSEQEQVTQDSDRTDLVLEDLSRLQRRLGDSNETGALVQREVSTASLDEVLAGLERVSTKGSRLFVDTPGPSNRQKQRERFVFGFAVVAEMLATKVMLYSADALALYVVNQMYTNKKIVFVDIFYLAPFLREWKWTLLAMYLFLFLVEWKWAFVVLLSVSILVIPLKSARWLIQALVGLRREVARTSNGLSVGEVLWEDFIRQMEGEKLAALQNQKLYRAIDPTLYDKEEHFCRMTVDFCALAVQQLVRSESLVWIVYILVPMFMSESNRTPIGKRLKYSIVQHMIVPRCTPGDQGIFREGYQNDVVEILRELSERNDKREPIGLPTLQMKVSKSRTIPVSYLPLDLATWFREPPMYGDGGILPELEVSSVPLTSSARAGQTSHIPVFVSHRWESEGKPNYQDEFRKLQGVLCCTIQCAIQASVMLLRCGFPLSRFIQKGLTMPEGFEIRQLLTDEIKDDMLNEDGDVNMIQQISGPLATNILMAAAEEVIREFELYNALPDKGIYPEESCRRSKRMKTPICTGTRNNKVPESVNCLDSSGPRKEMEKRWLLNVSRRIWLWYDYCCLPQHPLRDQRKELRERFNNTLGHLPELQQRNHTLCLNVSSTYSDRAWCLSEYLHAASNSPSGVSEFGFLVDSAPAKSKMRQALTLLLNPKIPFDEILSSLGIAFTNTKHSSYEDTICWILWNSTLRSKTIADDFFRETDIVNQHHGKFLVGHAEPKKILDWLGCIREALCRPWLQDNTGLLSPMSDVVDHLSYDINTWLTRRSDAFVNTLGPPEHTIVIEFKHGGRRECNHFLEACNTAMQRIKSEMVDNSSSFAVCELSFNCLDSPWDERQRRVGKNSEFWF